MEAEIVLMVGSWDEDANDEDDEDEDDKDDIHTYIYIMVKRILSSWHGKMKWSLRSTYARPVEGRPWSSDETDDDDHPLHSDNP